MTNKKITRATVKSFINKNSSNLFLNVKSSFDGMTDGCERHNGGFQEAKKTTEHQDNTLGVAGAWFVGDSRDYFTSFSNEIFEGVEVSNSCGHFILAVKK